jgi:predicted nuclease of predicted toxin-antitoxin system
VRLLFDEQLSEKLIAVLHDIFADSLHVRALGAGGSSDQRVWQLAREQGCILVTKDEDFHRLSVMHGAPPKVVWIGVEIVQLRLSLRFCVSTTQTFDDSLTTVKSRSWSSEPALGR